MNEWKKKPLLDLTFCFFFGQGNFVFIREKSGNFGNECLWQPLFIFAATRKMKLTKARKDVGTIFCGPISTWNCRDVRNPAFLWLACAASTSQTAFGRRLNDF